MAEKTSAPVPLSAASLMWELWERTAPTLSLDELERYEGATSLAGTHVYNLRDMVSGVGCLVLGDRHGDSNVGSFSDCSNLLFHINESLETISGLLDIGADAAVRLGSPATYQVAERAAAKARNG